MFLAVAMGTAVAETAGPNQKQAGQQTDTNNVGLRVFQLFPE
jgi:hypothetical protein